MTAGVVKGISAGVGVCCGCSVVLVVLVVVLMLKRKGDGAAWSFFVNSRGGEGVTPFELRKVKGMKMADINLQD
jgi:hypothetical protein